MKPMSQQERADLCAKIAKEWTDKGKLIEAGFQTMKIMVIPPDATPQQVLDMRMAFFGGAQHLFGSIMGMMDPGDGEPTDEDMKRVSLIADELDIFIKEFGKRAMPVAGNA